MEVVRAVFYKDIEEPLLLRGEYKRSEKNWMGGDTYLVPKPENLGRKIIHLSNAPGKYKPIDLQMDYNPNTALPPRRARNFFNPNYRGDGEEHPDNITACSSEWFGAPTFFSGSFILTLATVAFYGLYEFGGHPLLSFWGFIGCAICYGVYLWQSFKCETYQELKRITPAQETEERLQKMIATPPRVLFQASCGPLEEYVRVETDAQGRPCRLGSQQHLPYEKMETVIKDLEYTSESGYIWQDFTDKFDGLSPYLLTEIKFKSDIYMDHDTRRCINADAEKYKEHMKQHNLAKFYHNELCLHVPSWGLLCVTPTSLKPAKPTHTLPLATTHMGSAQQPATPWWLSVWFYTAASVLLLNWPYRMAFESNKGVLTIHVRKHISLSGTRAPEPVAAEEGGEK